MKSIMLQGSAVLSLLALEMFPFKGPVQSYLFHDNSESYPFLQAYFPAQVNNTFVSSRPCIPRSSVPTLCSHQNYGPFKKISPLASQILLSQSEYW